MKLELHKFDLPLRHTFTISRGSVDVQETLIVALHDGQYCGYGEATTNSYYSATIESMSSALHGLAAMLADWQFTTPDELWTAASVPLADNPQWIESNLDNPVVVTSRDDVWLVWCVQ